MNLDLKDRWGFLIWLSQDTNETDGSDADVGMSISVLRESPVE